MSRLLIVLIILVVPVHPTSAAQTTRYIPGEILVKFKPGTSVETVRQLHSKLKSKKKADLPLVEAQRVTIAPGLSVEEAVALYRQDPNVLYAEPNYIRRAFVSGSNLCLNDGNPNDPCPNDPRFNEQWGLHNTGQSISTNPPLAGSSGADIDAPEAWDITTGSSSVIVAMIDSGVDYIHPDLRNNIWNNNGDTWSNPQSPITGDGADNDGNGYIDDFHGWNFANKYTCDVNCNCQLTGSENNDPMDDSGHGTHVAGIVAAEGNNGTGVVGVLWAAKIMPLKILERNGCGSVDDEVHAIEYAINKGARIINASFGSPGRSDLEREAIIRAGAAGIVFVAAAGNDGLDDDSNPTFPAGYQLGNLISVAASNANDQLAFFSNFGQNRVDIAAPGDCIYSTTPIVIFPTKTFDLLNQVVCRNTPVTANYAYLSGTSMATPFVSGVAGLLLSQDSSLTPEEVRATILLTADAKDGLKGLVGSSGRLNASSALRRVKGSGLIGGGGGCGSPFGIVEPIDRGSTPPREDFLRTALFVMALFWPLLIPILRKRRGSWRAVIVRRIAMMAVAAITGLLVLWPPTVAAQPDDETDEETTTEETLPFEPFHSLALKLGYHRYDKSDYLDTNSGLLSRSDLAGLSTELEYDRRWNEKYSLSITLGHYQSKTDLKNRCCTDATFQTTYALITPKLYSPIPYLKPLEWYIGGGVGYYYFRREINGLIEDRLTANTAGLHALIGLRWPFLPRASVFTEARYALARVKSADPFDDSLDVGGPNYSLGLSWLFPASDRLSEPVVSPSFP